MSLFLCLAFVSLTREVLQFKTSWEVNWKESRLKQLIMQRRISQPPCGQLLWAYGVIRKIWLEKLEVMVVVASLPLNT